MSTPIRSATFLSALDDEARRRSSARTSACARLSFRPPASKSSPADVIRSNIESRRSSGRGHHDSRLLGGKRIGGGHVEPPSPGRRTYRDLAALRGQIGQVPPLSGTADFTPVPRRGGNGRTSIFRLPDRSTRTRASAVGENAAAAPPALGARYRSGVPALIPSSVRA